jgi:tripartite-type tricarboxylate transporter receptor subunit TctC
MRGIIAAFFSVAAAVSAAAQDFPKQSLRIIVPFPPGGAVDILSRAIAPKLQEAFKQSVIIENRAGNAGVIGMQAVARAAPDGHTLGIGTLSSLAIGPALSKNMGYDARKDFSLVAMMTGAHRHGDVAEPARQQPRRARGLGEEESDEDELLVERRGLLRTHRRRVA